MALLVGPPLLPPATLLRTAAAVAAAERTAEAVAAGSWAGQGADPGPGGGGAGPAPLGALFPFWAREEDAENEAAGAASMALGVGEVLRRRAYSCVMEAGGPGGGGRTLMPVLALHRCQEDEV